jgi:predicted patatin/cPLA2 family phospholipase
MKLKLKKYPKLLETMKNRHNNYNDTLEYIRKEEEKGTVLVLSPKEKLPIGRIEHKPERLKTVYELGRKTAAEQLDEIRNFLKTT